MALKGRQRASVADNSARGRNSNLSNYPVAALIARQYRSAHGLGDLSGRGPQRVRVRARPIRHAHLGGAEGFFDLLTARFRPRLPQSSADGYQPHRWRQIADRLALALDLNMMHWW